MNDFSPYSRLPHVQGVSRADVGPRPSPPRGRPPDPRKRQAILEAARRIFLNEGYEASLDAVARQAGVSRQTIYNLYGGKDELFLAVLRDRSEQLAAPLSEADGDASPREVLLEVARRFIDVALTPEAIGFQRALISATQRFPKLAQTLYEPGPFKAVQRLAAYLVREAERGRLVVADPEEAAEQFFGMLKGSGHIKRLLFSGNDFDQDRPRDRIEACVDTFLRAYSRPEKEDAEDAKTLGERPASS